MIVLMKAYTIFVGNDSLNAMLELHQHTSNLIKNFCDTREVKDMSDIRLEQNKTALDWFKNWEALVMN